MVRPETTVSTPAPVSLVSASRTGIGLTPNASARCATVIDWPGASPPSRMSSHSRRNTPSCNVCL